MPELQPMGQEIKSNHHELFERLWSGQSLMEEWTAAVSGGVGHLVRRAEELADSGQTRLLLIFLI